MGSNWENVIPLESLCKSHFRISVNESNGADLIFKHPPFLPGPPTMKFHP